MAWVPKRGARGTTCSPRRPATSSCSTNGKIAGRDSRGDKGIARPWRAQPNYEPGSELRGPRHHVFRSRVPRVTLQTKHSVDASARSGRDHPPQSTHGREGAVAAAGLAALSRATVHTMGCPGCAVPTAAPGCRQWRSTCLRSGSSSCLDTRGCPDARTCTELHKFKALTRGSPIASRGKAIAYGAKADAARGYYAMPESIPTAHFARRLGRVPERRRGLRGRAPRDDQVGAAAGRDIVDSLLRMDFSRAQLSDLSRASMQAGATRSCVAAAIFTRIASGGGGLEQ